jgi:nanoRNase/pAp phosphatase (c-di-AMP/oligoRNAs hydrolase)
LKKVNKTSLKIDKLSRLLKGSTDMLILMQDNPDPDSIAASV